jgi:hypothetical protein
VRITSIALLAVLGALLLAGCGGGDDGGASSSAPTATAAAAASGSTLEGTGYALTLPGGWRDASEEDTGLSRAPDAVLASTQPAAVALVTIEDQPEGVAADELLRTLRRREIDREVVTGAGEARPFAVAGARGVTYHYDTTSEAGVPLRTRQVVVIRAGKAYTIALTTPVVAFAAANDEFQAILDSWRWAAATG